MAERRQKELESELETLKERLDASQRAWSAMRKELADEKSQRAAEVDRDRLAMAAEQQAKSFKECLARMLSDSVVSVKPYEEQIRERVEMTIITLHDKTAVSHTHRFNRSPKCTEIRGKITGNALSEAAENFVMEY